MLNIQNLNEIYRDTLKAQLAQNSDTDSDFSSLISSLYLQPKNWQLDLLFEILNGVANGGENQALYHIVYASYGVGKTTFLAFLLLTHMYLFGYCKPKTVTYKGNVVAGSQIQLNTVTHSEIKKMLEFSGFKNFFTLTQNILYVTNNPTKFVRFCVCNEENIDSFAGQHSANGYFINIFDEGTAICDKAYEIADTFMDRGNCIWTVVGNPTTTAGKFYQLCCSERWVQINVTRMDFYGEDDPWAQGIAIDYGINSDHYRVKVLGQFPVHDVSTVFDLYTLNKSLDFGQLIHGSVQKKHAIGEVVIGVDVSRGEGYCDHAIVVRDRLAVRAIHESQVALTALPQQIVDIAKQYDVRSIFIDAIGCGAGVDKYLMLALKESTSFRGKKIPYVCSIISSARPHVNGNCVNRRSELIANAKDWLVNAGGICPSILSEKMVNQLKTITLDQTSEKYKITPKKGANDLADAFFYSFADYSFF